MRSAPTIAPPPSHSPLRGGSSSRGASELRFRRPFSSHPRTRARPSYCRPCPPEPRCYALLMFELDRLPEYNRGTLIAELKRVASVVPDETLTIAAFENHGRANRSTLIRHFGSWAEALIAAGLEDRLNPRLKVMSRDELLEAIRNLAARLGKTLTIPDVEQHLGVSGDRLRREWGTARKAFEAAGVRSTNVGRRYSDAECFDNMLAVWTHYGRPPQYREMSHPPSTVGGKAYVKRFGTWNKALAAFVERVNADATADSRESKQSFSRSEEKKNSRAKSQAQGPRDVPLGLRFKVLRRDSFRCVLCGDNPPTNPQCVLNVDHIVPWSKGGPTVLENLRTLCAPCNLGRSNGYMD